MAPLFENKQKNFLLQQGFSVEPTACSSKYGALQFQPRVVGVLFLIGVFFQSWLVFLLTAGLLACSAWKPEKNPFELLYNRTFGKKPGAEQLGVAPPPRQFAQAMAAVILCLIALCLFFNRPLWAWLLEFIMAVALLALITTGFCVGSLVYHFRKGNSSFAKQTLPWS